ncbi:MAG: hypothetical protein AAB305_07045, partial [Candidatus Zixiibacteriota bacterium]
MRRFILTGLILCTTNAWCQLWPYPTCHAWHDINNIRLSVDNYGNYGSNYTFTDCLDGLRSEPSLSEYPIGSHNSYFLSILPLVGAIKGQDPIVVSNTGLSSGWIDLSANLIPPNLIPHGTVSRRSTIDPNSPLFIGAVSPQDIIVEVDDSIKAETFDPLSHRKNKRLNASLTMESFAWSYEYTEDFILVRITVANKGNLSWKEAYLGVLMEGGVKGRDCDTCQLANFEDMTGLIWYNAALPNCELLPDYPLMWMAHNSGTPVGDSFCDNWCYDPVSGARNISNRSVVAVGMLSSQNSGMTVSYNWWARKDSADSKGYGPMRRDNYWDFQTGSLGQPLGNANLYWTMANGDLDYDQAYSSLISDDQTVWVGANSEVAARISDGAYVDQMLSAGSFTVDPGGQIEYSFVIVFGERFHTNPNNLLNLPFNPTVYRNNLDFSDLTKNALWAQWVYDNPGVDTDGDGYRGEFHVCVTDSVLIGGNWTVAKAETTYYRGDGVPDWKGASAPPAPKVWVEPLLNGVRIRWNGARSETEKDAFLQAVDFEGYHVYFGRDNREASMQLIAQYDRQNYDKHTFIPIPNDSGLWETSWEVQNIPFTLEELRCLYGNSCYDSSFDPETFTITNTYRFPNFP